MNQPQEIFDYQILHLTEKFYQDYPNPPNLEILKKKQRAYNCLLLQSHYGYFICVPYRSEISHSNAYLFKNSRRSFSHKSGLDFSKAAIITNPAYISKDHALIDQDEFAETRKNIVKIAKRVVKYVDEYVAHVEGSSLLHSEEFKRRYQYSTLKYFHRELGLE